MPSSRLHTTFDIFAWYREVRARRQPIAWCSAFAPAEMLVAMGIVPVYPENHAAMLGALAENRDLKAPYSQAALTGAEAQGYASPRLCSYALADLGVLTAGAASPIGGLPEPDLFYACDSQCAVVGRWGDDVQRHFQATSGRLVPHYLLRAPPLTRSETHSEVELAGFSAQMHAHAADIGQRFGTQLDMSRLREVVAESAAANRLWQECLELGRHQPAPWTSFDAFTAMAPIVIARGFPICTDFYRRLRDELQERINARFAAVPGERLRLLWDAIPIWPRKNWLAQQFAERGVAMVTSTYTHSWWFNFKIDQPFDTLVQRYAWNTMNRSGQWVLDWTIDLVRAYSCAGVVAHWNRSCGIWNSYVKRRLPGLAAANIPTLRLDADMVDVRAFDETVVAAQIDTFVSTLLAEIQPKQ